MSTNCLDVRIRFQLGKTKSLEEALELAESFYGKAPDYDEEFYWDDPDEHGFKPAWAEDIVFLDYILESVYDAYDVDVTVDEKLINEARSKFLANYGSYPKEPVVRVFLYYNGGCCGLDEVK